MEGNGICSNILMIFTIFIRITDVSTLLNSIILKIRQEDCKAIINKPSLSHETTLPRGRVKDFAYDPGPSASLPSLDVTSRPFLLDLLLP